MEVPLLSQDDFFRHLNLRSVHATSAKYHYRQALKERLRASSQSASLSPPPSKKAKLETKSPILSPVKWLTPKTRKKLFGRPKIRSEGRRILDFDNNLIPSGKVEESGLLKSLLSNCHVLRHPGVRQEVEAKIQCGTSKHFQLEDEFWEPPNSCIQIRKTYIKKTSNNPLKKQNKRNNRKRKTHVIHYRPQPPLKDSETHRKKEQKISAALALYHSYKPLKDNGQNFSFKEFTKVFVTHPLLKSLCTNSPSIKLKKLTNNQLRMCQKPVEKAVKIQPQNQNTSVETIEIQKTAYGRQVKPVLVPIKNETNVRCEHCDLTFSNLVNLKQHQVKKHGKNLQKKEVQLKDHYLCNPRKIIENNNFHCDICYRRFAKRSRMIRHIKSVHSADIHRVDLNRFVLPTKKIQMPTWSMIEL